MLLTRAPLYWGRSPFSCDLHVLGAPLTFVLSQDQTLQLNLLSSQVVGWKTGRAWALACGMEITSARAAGLAATCLASPGPVRHGFGRDSFIAHETLNASVRFSFQGARTGATQLRVPQSGGGNLVSVSVSVKRFVHLFLMLESLGMTGEA